MQLVANNNLLVYTSTPRYTNNSGAMLTTRPTWIP